MMSSTLGAPFAGTTRGGHQVFESLALSLITPPNFGGGGGSCLPSIVVVALGEPTVPVVCCAMAGATIIVVARRSAVKTAAVSNSGDFSFISMPSQICRLTVPKWQEMVIRFARVVSSNQHSTSEKPARRFTGLSNSPTRST
jgi:hypothetical protein